MSELENPVGEQQEFLERQREIYQDILNFFHRYGFELTPAEAVYLRKVIIEVLQENKKTESDMEKVAPVIEARARFFWGYYGINFGDYLQKTQVRDGEYRADRKAIEDLFKLIKIKYRPEKELM